jgi:hypothetical protein
MDKINFNFALDVQDKTTDNDFIESLKSVMKDYINQIDKNKSIGNILVFTDNSACKFQGHNIVLIDDINALALDWWNTISIRDRLPLFKKYYPSSSATCLMDITEDEIKEIWKNEKL